MKKRLMSVIAVVLTMLVVSGCGGKSVEVNSQELADALKAGITYKDDISVIDLETAKMFYSFSDAAITESVFYEGSGGTAEEIVVIKCESEADAAKIEEAFRQRMSEQKEAFTDYVPGELEKINAAVIYKKGNMAVLSVSDEPDKARSIIDSYFK
ncbi:MAG: DUF4358 domain-containing protein [Lachnospiraceae bacterium]|nr:DUF4358 domain-containing protein [Lachnospiraceae bacterium]